MENQKIAQIALGGMLVAAGIAHLTFARKEFQAQVPDWVPLKKDDTVIYSGTAEIALGAGLILAPKKYQKPAGIFAGTFFAAVFPGNVSQYINRRDAFSLNTDKRRFARLFMQPILIAWALYSGKK
ncbi:hypothetical protein ASG31_10795 [Chryseobacterium sp. Leaf404]|uniref:DoxX family protein n=1 Tax=unclassified Chryseobacterium TaxID=2593645 RepID=UPI0006F9AFD6|nr:MULTISPECIES: hypothetical protein [unclassified Chryseobacterium]KQT16857.1 hypothetical protein ASG31_10795 [Chryseobacterium sp. Leaf404]